MGYYGASAYRGDYYGQGDYYRNPAGDPGFFDFLGGVAKTVGGAVGSILPYAAPVVGGILGGPVGAAIGGAAGTMIGRVLGPGPPIPNPPLVMAGPMLSPPTWAATSPGTGSTAAMIPVMPPAFTGVSLGGPAGLQIGRSTPMPGGSALRTVGMVPHPSVGGHYHRGGGGSTHTVFRRVASWQVKDSRRMNPLNPRALRKAIRRAGAFTKIVGKTLRFTKPGHHVGGFKHHRKKK